MVSPRGCFSGRFPPDRSVPIGERHEAILTFPWKVFEKILGCEKMADVAKEYERIKALFTNVDEKQLALVDGAIWEAARLRVELDRLHEIVGQTGLVKLHPDNSDLQKELPVSKLIVKVRANYLNYIAKLSKVLGAGIDDDEDELDEFI
jgi:hypothetical protein